jgi:hypothetical protein
MSFDVFGPTRHVRASNTDDGVEPLYDIFALPIVFGLHCPQLEKLSQRFYDSTILRFGCGEVHGLRDELVRLQAVYRARREGELIVERQITARDFGVRSAIVERLLGQDCVYCVLDEFRLLCEEAIAANANVRCEGD